MSRPIIIIIKRGGAILSNQRGIPSLKSLLQSATVTIILVGRLVLVGWLLDFATLKTVFPGLLAMNAATALTFILAGLSLWLTHTEEGTKLSVPIRQVICMRV